MKKIIIIFIALIIVLSVLYYFYWPNNDTIAFNPDNSTLFIVEGKQVDIQNKPYIDDGKILFSVDTIKEFIDPKAYWDKDKERIIFTTKDKVIKMNTNSLTAMVNSNPLEINVPVQIIDNIPYIPIEFLSDVFGIELTYIDQTNTVILDYTNSIKRQAKVINKEAKIRKDPSIKAPILVSLEAGATMRAFDEYEKWYKVRTDTGIIGYVKKEYVKNYYLYTKSYDSSTSTPKWKPISGKINMVFDYIHKTTPDMSNVKSIDGLDVISPTWFNILDSEGNLNNKASKEYVTWAHNNNYMVWALVTNSFDPDLTNIILNDSDLREKVIEQLLVYANIYKFDGINIDFENIYMKDKDMLTQFVRELVPLAHEQGLIVSIDVTVMGGSENWSLCYDRKAFAEVVDYVCLMTYDQHWSTSPKAGSVAQLTWVENNLKKVLQEVPPEKLLLGLPFYTRIWEEKVEDGAVQVFSKAFSMEDAESRVTQNNAEKNWDNESAQYYAEYSKDESRYRVWLEDAESINLKSSLVHKYNLAGVSSWRLGFETKDIWEVLNNNLKVYNNYEEWSVNN